MVTLAAYFDESKDTDGYFAMAGYLSTVDHWDTRFSPAWNAVLAEYQISEFKASDCRNGYGAFEGWPRDRRDEITARLVSVITDESQPDVLLIGLGAGLTTRAFEKGIDRRKFEIFSYLYCLKRVVEFVLMACSAATAEDTLQFVFDERADIEHKATLAFDDAIRQLGHLFPGKIRKPHFAPSADLAPLQAADLLAYESFKELRNRDNDEPLPVSFALHRLVSERPHLGEYLDRMAVTGLIHIVAGEEEPVNTAQVALGRLLFRGTSRLYFSGQPEPIRGEKSGRLFSWWQRRLLVWLHSLLPSGREVDASLNPRDGQAKKKD